MKKLTIVWRNPSRQQYVWRWQALKRDLERSIYLVQELVLQDNSDERWSPAIFFEVHHGGRLAPQVA
jgi:hypothetical protein